MLHLLNWLRRVYGGILERAQPGGKCHGIAVLHDIFKLVRHLALLPLLFESLGHIGLGIENFLFDLSSREIRTDVVQLGTALLSSLSLELVAVIALVQLPLFFTYLHKVSGGRLRLNRRDATNWKLFRYLLTTAQGLQSDF